MRLDDVFSALEYAGGFTWQRSRRKQSHYRVRRVDTQQSFTLPVAHNGEVAAVWVLRLRSHFAMRNEPDDRTEPRIDQFE
jgi:predicted RNA binding protein YcfA (HicA-like mRNA interferase family)